MKLTMAEEVIIAECKGLVNVKQRSIVHAGSLHRHRIMECWRPCAVCKLYSMGLLQAWAIA